MPTERHQAAEANRHFAETIINTAADIVDRTPRLPDQDPSAITSLMQARDDFLGKEPAAHRKNRTYAYPQLQNDLGQYIRDRYDQYRPSYSPISEWSRDATQKTVAAVLREAAPVVGESIRQYTLEANWLELMSDQELSEYRVMRKGAGFLAEHGLAVQIQWQRDDPNGPIDYWGTVGNEPWAFEITELRKDPKGGYFRTIGHPKSKRTFAEEFQSLAEPLRQVPQGPDILQRALNKAVQHGLQANKLSALDGAKYCLIIQNRQFVWVDDWNHITLPDLTGFDAVLMLHQETFLTGIEVWEVLRNDFGQPLNSQTAADLDVLVEIKRSTGTINAELLLSARQRFAELDLTEDDLLDAVREVRKQRYAELNLIEAGFQETPPDIREQPDV